MSHQIREDEKDELRPDENMPVDKKEHQPDGKLKNQSPPPPRAHKHQIKNTQKHDDKAVGK